MVQRGGDLELGRLRVGPTLLGEHPEGPGVLTTFEPNFSRNISEFGDVIEALNRIGCVLCGTEQPGSTAATIPGCSLLFPAARAGMELLSPHKPHL